MTRDVEVRTTGSGLAVATGRVAVHNRKKEGTEWVDAPVFIDVVAFGEKGETFANNCKKGERVYIAGRLSYSEWEKDGQKRSKIEVSVMRAYPFDPRKSSDAAEYAAPDAAQTPAPKQETFDADIPF